jgi:hypothetical protein
MSNGHIGLQHRSQARVTPSAFRVTQAMSASVQLTGHVLHGSRLFIDSTTAGNGCVRARSRTFVGA